MFSFLNSPVVEMLAYLLASLGFFGSAWFFWPEPEDEETGEIRTRRERWELASRSLKVDLLFGFAALGGAALSLLEILGIWKLE